MDSWILVYSALMCVIIQHPPLPPRGSSSAEYSRKERIIKNKNPLNVFVYLLLIINYVKVFTFQTKCHFMSHCKLMLASSIADTISNDI